MPPAKKPRQMTKKNWEREKDIQGQLHEFFSDECGLYSDDEDPADYDCDDEANQWPQCEYFTDFSVGTVPRFFVDGLEMAYPVNGSLFYHQNCEGDHKSWLMSFPAERLFFDDENWQLLLSDSSQSELICTAIKNLGDECWLGDEKDKVSTRLEKLVIIQEGATFGLNELAGSSFGSLLIFLPSRYVGGQVQIRGSDEIKWQIATANNTNVTSSKVVAFHNQNFTGLTPIQHGSCAFLQYSLQGYDTPEVPSPLGYAKLARRLCRRFREILQLPRYMDKSAVIFLHRDYPLHNLQPADVSYLDLSSYYALKSNIGIEAGLEAEICLVEIEATGFSEFKKDYTAMGYALDNIFFADSNHEMDVTVRRASNENCRHVPGVGKPFKDDSWPSFEVFKSDKNNADFLMKFVYPFDNDMEGSGIVITDWQDTVVRNCKTTDTRLVKEDGSMAEFILVWRKAALIVKLKK